MYNRSMALIKCPSCGLTKPEEDFPADPGRKSSGTYGYCKRCKKEYMKDSRKKKPKKDDEDAPTPST